MIAATLILLLAPIWVVDLVLTTEIVLGLAPLRHSVSGDVPDRIAILVPAHQEAAVIGSAMERLRAVLPANARLLVVAHNCSDTTAQEAAAAGAEVVTLDRPDQRGKGYALAFGRDRLAADPPDVVIVIDADCTAEANAIATLAQAARTHGSAVQASYLFRTRPGDPPIVQISNFAMMVKNLVRQRGGRRIGTPALMTGSGMAFPWPRFATLDLATGNIVEDLAIGIELVEAGAPPLFVEQARIWSLPSSEAGTQTQRARWEGGFLATARRNGLPLLLRGIARRRWPDIAMGLHLLVPPLTLVLSINGLVWLGLGIVRLAGGPKVPFILASVHLAAILTAVLAAWAAAGREVLTGRTLLRLPLYLVWKLALYRRLARRTAPGGWTRTERID